MVPNEELPSLPLPSGRKPSYAVVLVTIMSMIVEPIVPTCEGDGEQVCVHIEICSLSWPKR